MKKFELELASAQSELGGLVENRITGEEGRCVDVAGNEPRVVPRGNVGNDAKRLPGDLLLELLVPHYLHDQQMDVPNR